MKFGDAPGGSNMKAKTKPAGSDLVTIELLDATFRGLHQQIIALHLVTGRLMAELVKASDDPQEAWDRIDGALAATMVDLCAPGGPDPGMMTYSIASVRENAAGLIAADRANVEPTHAAPHPARWTIPFLAVLRSNA
jgi:hypothetical protein